MDLEDPDIDIFDQPQNIQKSTNSSNRKRSSKPNRFTDPENDQDPYHGNDNPKVPNWTWDRSGPRSSNQLPTESHFYELFWEGTWWPCKYAKALSSGGHKIDFCDGTLDLEMDLTPDVWRPLTQLGVIAVGGVFQYYYCSGRDTTKKNKP